MEFKSVNAEKMIVEVLDDMIKPSYECILKEQIENRAELSDIIESEEREVKQTYEDYKTKKLIEGYEKGCLEIFEKNDNRIEFNPTNEEGIKIREDINEAEEELETELEEIEENAKSNFCGYINYEIDTDLNYCSSNLPEILQVIYSEDDRYKSIEDLKNNYLKNLEGKIEGMTDRERNIILDGGNLYINSIIESNLESYEKHIDSILSKLDE